MAGGRRRRRCSRCTWPAGPGGSSPTTATSGISLADTGQNEPPVIGALRNLFHYHAEALKFHAGLDSFHPYQSWPWQWLLLAGPITFHWTDEGGCGAAQLRLRGAAAGHPGCCGGRSCRRWRRWCGWASPVATGGRRRSCSARPPASCRGSSVERPDHVLLLRPAGRAVPGARRGLRARRARSTPQPAGDDRASGSTGARSGAVLAGTFVLLVALNFMYFYPIYTGESIPYEAWQARMWMGNRWIAPNPTVVASCGAARSTATGRDCRKKVSAGIVLTHRTQPAGWDRVRRRRTAARRCRRTAFEGSSVTSGGAACGLRTDSLG